MIAALATGRPRIARPRRRDAREQAPRVEHREADAGDDAGEPEREGATSTTPNAVRSSAIAPSSSTSALGHGIMPPDTPRASSDRHDS